VTVVDPYTTADTICVALASDARYAMPLTVAICSAAANCNKERRLIFYVIHDGITPSLQKKAETSLAATRFPNARIEWVSVAIDQFRDLKLSQSYFSRMIYARLLIPFVLPPVVEKVLYLDCDVVVEGDLAALWDFDLGEKALLAVRDRIGSVSSVGDLQNYRELGIAPDTKYLNSGVLLMNLRKWRDTKISERVLDYLKRHTELMQMDQEGLNAILFDDWGELPFRWNWQIPWRMHRRGRRKMQWVPEDNVKHIIHFTTAEKPWLAGCDVEEKRHFFEYLDRTEWAGWRVPFVKEVFGRSRRLVGDIRTFIGERRRKISGHRTSSREAGAPRHRP
jgi:lipopolysaccharide biosynthesis glycosyltransferase